MLKAGSSEAIAQWSNEADSLLSEIEQLREARRSEIIKEQTLASARRIIRQTRESALKELSSLANA